MNIISEGRVHDPFTRDEDVLNEVLEAVRSMAGLRASTIRTVSRSSNSIVLLLPERVVAKVSAHRRALRAGPSWAEREVHVAGYLIRAGITAVRPCTSPDPGPYVVGPHVVTLWELSQVRARKAEPRAVGACLRRCHDALNSFPRVAWPFSPVGEIRHVVASVPHSHWLPSEHELLAEVAEDIAAWHASLEVRRQVIHGDAMEGNFALTDAGLTVFDLEDAHVGSPLWDVACLTAPAVISGDRSRVSHLLQGYAPDPNRGELDGLDEFLMARVAHQAAWSAYVNHSGPSRARAARLAWLAVARDGRRRMTW